MRSINIRSDPKAIEHHVYDLSLPVEERSLKRLIFKSGMAAAAYLGIRFQTLHQRAKPGYQIYSPIHQKYFAVRPKKSGNAGSFI